MKRSLTHIALVILYGLFFKCAGAQVPVEQNNRLLTFQLPSSDIENLEKAKKHAYSELELLHANGFLEATLDSIAENSEYITLYINKGKEYFYKIEQFDIADMVLSIKDIDLLTQNPHLSFPEFETLTKKVLEYYSNHGYPFAQINKHNVKIRQNIIHLHLEAVPNDLILYDSLQVSGDAKLNNFFLENFLGIVRGNAYNEKQVAEAEKKIRELDFVELTGPLLLSFAPGRASLLLPLKSNQANRFDGMAGFGGGTDPETPFQVNGLLNLYLSNALGMGEFIDLSWQGPGRGTQILSLNAGYPYPFRLPLEAEIMFSLHRQDTSWLQLQFKPALIFSLSTSHKAGLFWHYTANNLISTQAWSSSGALPAELDFKINLYGLEYRHSTRAFYRQLLQGGLYIKISTAAGFREVMKNVNFPEDAYTGLQLRKPQLNLSFNAERRWLTGKRATLSIKGRAAYINGNKLPRNQLFLLGGFKTLKGFDELSLLASAYALADLEFRFFTAPQSYFSLFVNGGWYEQKTATESYFNDFPLGFGTGLNLQTQAGIFSLNLALGIQKNLAPEFRNAKVHIGYISAF